MGDARGQHAGLAGAGAGQHQHRAVERLDRLALLASRSRSPRTDASGPFCCLPKNITASSGATAALLWQAISRTKKSKR
jgi:hypothetical protein